VKLRSGVQIRLYAADIKRFVSHFEKTANSCWLWVGAKMTNGYGSFRVGRQKLLAHRVAWAVKFGVVESAQCCLHRCDTPACVNPDHLFLGTPADNASDMVKKGRQCAGEKNARSKLNEAKVRSIVTRVKRGEKYENIASDFGVTDSTIALIANGRTWRVVTGGKGASLGEHGLRKHPQCASRGNQHWSRLHPERVLRGNANGAAVLTEETVRELLVFLGAGNSQAEAHRKFNLSRQQVNRIALRKRWRHVEV